MPKEYALLVTKSIGIPAINLRIDDNDDCGVYIFVGVCQQKQKLAKSNKILSFPSSLPLNSPLTSAAHSPKKSAHFLRIKFWFVCVCAINFINTALTKSRITHLHVVVFSLFVFFAFACFFFGLSIQKQI